MATSVDEIIKETEARTALFAPKYKPLAPFIFRRQHAKRFENEQIKDLSSDTLA